VPDIITISYTVSLHWLSITPLVKLLTRQDSMLNLQMLLGVHSRTEHGLSVGLSRF